MRINKHDTNGTKPLLGKGELGYDDYPSGGDTGRVYVGNGASNIALAKKSEVDAKVVANAGITAGTATKVTYDAKGLVTSGTNPTTLSGYGITDAYTKTETNTQISTAVNGLVDAAPGTLDTLNELAAALGDDPNFATTTANAIAAKVDKVTSTDNAIVRFDGVTGAVQNSGVTIDDNNNVGIGVTPSAWGSAGNTKVIDFHTNGAIGIVSGGLNIKYNNYYNGTNDVYKTNGFATNYLQNSGKHYWYTAPSGTAGNPITWTDAMTLDANGKLIFGSITSGARISITGDSALYGDNHILFRNNPTTNYGNIIFQNASGIQVGYIQATSTATAYNTSSDYRLKEDWKPMENSIERLMSLKPCNFRWKETGTRVDGFIAHELQEVIPEVVSGIKDAIREEEYEISPRVDATYDEDGNELTTAIEAVIGKREVPDYQGIDQSKMVPLLTASLQEVVKLIEDLKARIEILEGAK